MCKRNMRIAISRLTRKEYSLCLEEANFTEDQRKVFEMLNRDQCYDIGIMTALSLPLHRYYDIKGVVMDKVERIATEYGFIDKIKDR